MKPEIKRVGPNTYTLPVYSIGEKELTYTEADKTLQFVRPEIQKVSEQQISQAQAYKAELEKKEELTEQEQEVITKIDEMIKGGPQTLPATEGMTIVDLAMVLLIEASELKANPQALVKLEEFLYWIKK